MNYCVFDIETDGLLDSVSKIHCIYYLVTDGQSIIEEGVTDVSIFEKDYIFVGHNIIRYDIPVVEKLYKKLNIKKIDTLGLSWYLYPLNKKHGLEYWGNVLGISKVEILDWKNLSESDYIQRCKTDVHINFRLFQQQLKVLNQLYESLDRVVSYLNFKLTCLKEQEDNPILIDIEKVIEYRDELEEMFNEISTKLSLAMPKELGKIIKSKPKKCYKADGSLSVAGEDWFNFLKANNLKDDVVEVREAPNPGSTIQVKDWLYSLGWKPITFKVSKNTGKKVPQVNLPFGKGLCPSLKELNVEELLLLETYFKVRHRLGIFKSYLSKVKNGRVIATANKLTNTLRLRHSEPIVNLPKPSVYYGDRIRGVLIAPQNQLMCGIDISSLEDSTKQHYIYPLDPEYVTEMQREDFDPHIDIGIRAGLITEEEGRMYIEQENSETELYDKELIKSIGKKRFVAKTTNFSATYLAGPGKIAETAKISLEEGQKLYDIYWKRNWAIKPVTKNTIRKKVSYINFGRQYKQLFIYNPVSKLWIFIKDEKDIFSSLNQSTGVYVFDRLLKCFKSLCNIPIQFQYHDEFMFSCPEEMKEEVNNKLKEATALLNHELKLNVTIKTSVVWGKNYAEVH